MGMSTHVYGFKPPDDKWKKMKAVWDACEEAGADPPDLVKKFFNYEPPDDAGVKISEKALKACGALKDYKEAMRTGFELDLTKIPKDVTVIRFVNSW